MEEYKLAATQARTACGFCSAFNAESKKENALELIVTKEAPKTSPLTRIPVVSPRWFGENAMKGLKPKGPIRTKLLPEPKTTTAPPNSFVQEPEVIKVSKKKHDYATLFTMSQQAKPPSFESNRSKNISNNEDNNTKIVKTTSSCYIKKPLFSFTSSNKNILKSSSANTLPSASKIQVPPLDIKGIDPQIDPSGPSPSSTHSSSFGADHHFSKGSSSGNLDNHIEKNEAPEGNHCNSNAALLPLCGSGQSTARSSTYNNNNHHTTNNNLPEAGHKDVHLTLAKSHACRTYSDEVLHALREHMKENAHRLHSRDNITQDEVLSMTTLVDHHPLTKRICSTRLFSDESSMETDLHPEIKKDNLSEIISEVDEDNNALKESTRLSSHVLPPFSMNKSSSFLVTESSSLLLCTDRNLKGQHTNDNSFLSPQRSNAIHSIATDSGVHGFGSGNVSTVPVENRRELLKFLLKLGGNTSAIYLTAKELDHLQLEEIHDIFAQIRHQNIIGAQWPRRLCYKLPAVIVFAIFGLLLLLLGCIVFFITREAHEWFIPYTSSDTSVPLVILKHSNWIEGKEAYLYFQINGFHDTYRTYINSRPRELFGPYSCGEWTTVKSIRSVRPLSSLPNTHFASMNDEDPIFPCGLSSLAVFQDQVDLKYLGNGHSNTSTDIKIDRAYVTDDFKYVLYTNKARPSRLTPHNDWVDVKSAEYRNWMEPHPGSSKRVLWARLPSGMPYGRYLVNFTQNTWPAELWNAQKFLVISIASPLGNDQSEVGILFIVWGAAMIFASLIFLVAVQLDLRLGTQSSSEVPMDQIESVIHSLQQRYDATQKTVERMTRMQTLSHFNSQHTQ